MSAILRLLAAALLGMVLIAGAAQAHAQDGAASPAAPPTVSLPEARAAAHARSLEAAKVVAAQADTVVKAGADGLTPEYRDAILIYFDIHYRITVAIGAEADLDPEVMARAAETETARRRLDETRVSVDSTPLDLAVATDRLNDAWAAQEKAKAAAVARLTADLAAQGLAVPDPRSPSLFAKGMTQSLIPDFPVVGVHGQEYTPFPNAPWQVELQWADMDAVTPPMAAVDLHACGGALIRSEWVLTAAHCIWDRKAGKPYDKASFRARAGGKDMAGAMQSSAIDAIILPGGARTYVVSTAFKPAQNDIALLRLKTPIRLAGPGVGLIPIAPANFQPLEKAGDLTVSGWGATQAESFGDQTSRAVQGGRLRMSPALRFAPLKAIGNPECLSRMQERIREVYPTAAVGPLTATSLCAGAPHTGTCVGDSGGPLVAHGIFSETFRGDPARGDRPVLVGIVSWGVGCEDFTVFTRVSSYSDWINATISQSGRRRR